MKLHQVAAQLYTLREYCQTPAAVAETLRKVRVIGYTAVQVSSVCHMPERELASILAGEGLTCCATHEPGTKILAEPERVSERLSQLGCRYTAYPHPSGIDLADPTAVTSLIQSLDHAGSILRQAGQTLTYHNHADELARPGGGKTILDRIYDETDPQHLQGEIDTYWIQTGGGDPVAWCRKLKHRLPLLHAKDYIWTTANERAFGEIGRGNLDFPAIVEAAEASGMEWFIVEQDTCPGDPFDSLQISFDYIATHLVS